MTAPSIRDRLADVAGRRVGRGPGHPAHAGLLLSRFLRVPVQDQEKQHPVIRRVLLDDVGIASENARSVYQGAFTRWESLLPAGAEARRFTVESRLVTGLGNANVLEAGIALHHTYGVPWIPGSGVKGLAAHYCDRIWGNRDEPDLSKLDPPSLERALKYRRVYEKDDPDKDKYGERRELVGQFHKALFGTTDTAGLITFHDAWICPESLSGNDAQGRPRGLLRDVLTPHHTDYYDDVNAGKTGSDVRPPTDFDDPNPISFLSVRGTFLFALSCDPIDGDDSGEKAGGVLSVAWKILEAALQHWGIGGKTSSGYGRMTGVQSARVD